MHIPRTEVHTLHPSACKRPLHSNILGSYRKALMVGFLATFCNTKQMLLLETADFTLLFLLTRLILIDSGRDLKANSAPECTRDMARSNQIPIMT